MLIIRKIINILKFIKSKLRFIYSASIRKNYNYFKIIKFMLFFLYCFISGLIKNLIYKNTKTEYINYFKKFKFSNDWFTNNIPIWVPILNKKKNNKILKILEIGSYEGMSAIFFLDFFKNAKIDCVETFEGSDEHSDINFTKIKKNFEFNLSEFEDRYKIFQTSSDNFFEKNTGESNLYDIIYVDGSHESNQVKNDAYNSFNLLRENGIMVFDDFLRDHYTDIDRNPFSAIIHFIENNNKKINIIHFGYQLILQKY